MKVVWTLVLAFVWLAAGWAVTVTLLDDYGTGIGAGIAVLVVAAVALVTVPLGLLGAWRLHRAYEDRRLFAALAIAAALGAGLQIASYRSRHRPYVPIELPALHRAAADGSLERVRTLLDEGADPNEVDGTGQRPLHYAAESGPPAMVALLRERGGSLPPDELIRMAAYNPDPAVMALALEGVEVPRSEAAASALRFALCAPNPPMVELLLERGAAVQATSGHDHALLVAAGCGETRFLDRLEADDAVRAAALFAALDERHPGAVQALVEAGVDPNRRRDDGAGPSPLGAAVAYQEPELIRILVARGGRLNEPTGDLGMHQTAWPLQIALDTFDQRTVETLLELGANLPGRDLSTAVAERGPEDVARQLLAEHEAY